MFRGIQKSETTNQSSSSWLEKLYTYQFTDLMLILFTLPCIMCFSPRWAIKSVSGSCYVTHTHILKPIEGKQILNTHLVASHDFPQTCWYCEKAPHELVLKPGLPNISAFCLISLFISWRKERPVLVQWKASSELTNVWQGDKGVALRYAACLAAGCSVCSSLSSKADGTHREKNKLMKYFIKMRNCVHRAPRSHCPSPRD